MTLLDVARGPALEFAFAVFAIGVAWRLLSVLLLPWATERSAKRPGTPSRAMGAIGLFVRHLWPAGPFRRNALFITLNSYVFHLGLAIVVFGLAQHIVFLQNAFGVSWPSLPSGVVYVVAVITLATLAAALAHRLTSPVLRLLSTFNDYMSWFVTAAPVATGLLAVSHLWAPYETLLAIHILSVALLLAWFPFGKLMHSFLVFLTRSETGAFYSRRGVEI
ncbi:MAG: nitrate reductase [Alphaproteobacteria bacterium]|nr:nitrate reductase [Alphaproteobacteria bacterium]MBU6472697.1 nitrate reductase [Alphaproteobacteria bacterium]MDE2013971.1 nitrate reductase [Alphaproteobacteria bacterium]MDE2074281.1 nitrate reductase [Alphaproteobacteria bacterium]MDE2352176.1 nitrate reductase [Alphaproteobacteria bacterium]